MKSELTRHLNQTLRLLLWTMALSGTLSASGPAQPLRLDFDGPLREDMIRHGNVRLEREGPRPPEFPNFGHDNTAVYFPVKGGFIEIPDPGPSSEFDFANNDALTLEAWIKLDGVQSRAPMYIIGKGRSNLSAYQADNQNWSLRITVDSSDIARVGFLFATSPTDVEPSTDSHWHRWTSADGFSPETGWHHIAVQYRFGQPESIMGWIDGRQTTGTWDLGGKTTKAPVVDDDSVYVGSSLNGNQANCVRGFLDSVVVHRRIVEEDVLRSRFERTGGRRTLVALPEEMPDVARVPAEHVVVTLHESLPSYRRWLNEGEQWPEEALRWEGDHFLLPRLPLRYDEWGIRDRWRAPLLMRMAGDVELPPGKHRFMMRARGLSRLWIDGQLVARTDADIFNPPDGEEPITPLAKPPAPGTRPHGYHQQEAFGFWGHDEQQAARCRIVFEVVVGGERRRTETGEVCVGIQFDQGQPFRLVSSKSVESLPELADETVEHLLAGIESSLAAFDDRNRWEAAASQNAFWRQRHEYARSWLDESSPPPIPDNGHDHPVDAFIAAKIHRAVAEAAKFDANTTQHFHDNVLPILQENCFRCHGEKDKGGLKLSTRELALRGGESGAAIVPGSPAESYLVERISSDDESERMPPSNSLSDNQIAVLEQWIRDGAVWPQAPVDKEVTEGAPLIEDTAFLRRVYLDTVGIPPTAEEARAFLASQNPDKRAQLIEDLLADPRGAHHWMSFWLDMLAENPVLINQAMNSTGPFRWFLFESLRDNKPLDRMMTELILMRGGQDEGGSAGFAQAGENDAPLAEKAHILASALLGIEMRCARCHDSPYHSTTQRDLYSLAAMLGRKPATVPPSSRVPAAFFEQQQREPLIQVTLSPNEEVAPLWSLEAATSMRDTEQLDRLLQDPEDTRERLAALITAPENRRFTHVFVNRVWQRLIGAGFVQPAHDWEGRSPSHPELLNWLSADFIASGYDIHHLVRRILTSQLYQREAVGKNQDVAPSQRYFYAPERRRLTAEQVVDSLHAVTTEAMDVEELTFVHDGRRPLGHRLTLGTPSRAWMFAGLNNERDRPSLSLPRARAVADVLKAFGWDGSRGQPIHERETDANVLQPGILGNGVLANSLVRAAFGSRLAELAVSASSPEALADTLFLRILSRPPNDVESSFFGSKLSVGFQSRFVPEDQIAIPQRPDPLPQVTWFNHTRPKANSIQQERERRVLAGPPPDPRLRANWREVYEDVVWSLINHREFVWVP